MSAWVSFTFGAKDAGLNKRLKHYGVGFGKIHAALDDMGASGKKGASGVKDFTSALDTKQTEGLNASLEKLHALLEEQLPNSSAKTGKAIRQQSSVFNTYTRDAGRGLKLIEGAVSRLGKILSQVKLSNFLSVFSLSRLGDIARGVENLATGGRNLTTGYEAQLVQMDKSARATAVQFGMTGKAVGKFSAQASSMAIGLNIDVGKASSAIYVFNSNMDELKALGFKSAQSFAKFGEVLGVDTNQFGFFAAEVKSVLGDDAYAKNAKNLFGAFGRFGQQSGDVKGAFDMMKDVVPQLKEAATSSGQIMDGETLARYGKGVAVAAAGFFAVSHNAAEAKSLALSMSSNMVKARQNIANMFAGTEGDLSAMATELGVATGDINASFNLIKSNPDEFAKGLFQMVQAAKKNGVPLEQQMSFLGARLGAAFGPEQAAQLMQFFEKGGEKALDAMADAQSATTSLAKMGEEGYRTGRTLAESFELAENRFIKTFRDVGRAEARKFVSETGKEFDKFGKKAKEIASDGGPLGAIVKKFSEMHQVGALALLPQSLRPIAAVFGTMLKEGAPLIGMLGSLGFRLSMLGPLLPIAAFGAFVWAMKSAENQAVATAEEAANSGKSMRGLSQGVRDLEKQQQKLVYGTEAWNNVQRQIDQKNYLLKMAKAMKAAAGDEKKLAALRTQVAEHERQRSIEQVKRIAKSVTQKVGAFMQALPSIVREGAKMFVEVWKEIKDPLLDALKAAWSWVKTKAWPAIKDFLKGMWDGLIHGTKATGTSASTQLGARIGQVVRNALVFAWRWAKDTAWPAIVDFVKGVWDGLFRQAKADEPSASARLGASLGSAIRGAFDYAVKWVRDYLKGWWATVTAIWTDSSKSFTEKIKETFKASGGVFVLLAGSLFLVIPLLGRLLTLGGLLSGSFGLVPNVFWQLGSSLMFVLRPLGSLFKGFGQLAGRIGGLVFGTIPKIGSVFASVFAGVGVRLLAFGKGILAFFGSILAPLGSLLMKGLSPLIQIGQFVWAVISGLFGNLLAFLGPVGKVFVGLSAGAWAAIGAVVALGVAFTLWPEKTQAAVDWVTQKIREWLPKLVPIVMNALAFVAGMIWKVVSYVWSNMPQLLTGLVKALSAIVDIAIAALLGLFDGLQNWLMEKFPESAGTIKNVFDFLKSAVEVAGSAIKVVLKVIGWSFEVLWSVAKGVLKGLWWAFETFVLTPLGWIWKAVKKVLSAFSESSKYSDEQIAHAYEGGVHQMEAMPEKAAMAGAAAAEGATQAAKAVTDAAVTANENTLKAAQKGVEEQSKKLTENLGKAAETAASTTNVTMLRELEAVAKRAMEISETAKTEASVNAAKGILAEIENAQKAATAAKSKEDVAKAQQVLDGLKKQAADLELRVGKTQVGGFESTPASLEAFAGPAVKKKRKGGWTEEMGQQVVDGYQKAMGTMTENSKVFLTEQIKTFGTLTDTIVQKFQSAWDRILEASGRFAEQLSEQVSQALLRIETLAATAQAVQVLSEAPRAAPPPALSKPMTKEEREDALLQATHWPQWYEEYRVQFAKQMLGLQGAIQKSGTSQEPVRRGKALPPVRGNPTE